MSHYLAALAPLIFAKARFPLPAALDRDGSRAAWRARFENRTLSEREPGKIEVKALAGGTTTEMLLYDEIGYWGVTAKDFIQQLDAITTPSIVVRINSPGGDVMDGLAIYAALQAHPATISTQVDGWAASAASFIALASDTVTMAPNAFLMIHKAWSIAIGNADDFKAQAAVLDKIDGQLAAIYAKKTGMTAAAALGLMAAETWFTADEALEAKFISAICDPDAEGDVDPAPNPDPGADPLDAAAKARIQAMRRRLALAERD